MTFVRFLFHSLLISFAGMPPTTVFGSTSLVTTAPAPTMAFSPTVTPGRIAAPAPIQQLLFFAQTSYPLLDLFLFRAHLVLPTSIFPTA